MKTYRGTRSGNRIEVEADGQALTMKYFAFAPLVTDFSWGDSSAGSERLAFSLIADSVDEATAREFYHKFVSDVVSKLAAKWQMTSQDIEKFCLYYFALGYEAQTAPWSPVGSPKRGSAIGQIPLPPRIIADPNYDLKSNT